MLVFACASAALAVAAVIGLVVDQRTLGGAPLWAKPLKFGISGAVYGLTWAWLCPLIGRGQRTARRVSGLIVGLLSVELVLIVGQAVRGRPSHFNFRTALDALVYQIMSVSITTMWCSALVLTVLVLRSDIGDRPRKLTISLGALISLVGVGLGVLMTFPTGAQIDALVAGHGLDMIGAHAVGAPDDAPGLPLLGWSTTGGDLRIPHFFGMHALQVLPLWYMAIERLAVRWRRLRPAAVRARLVVIAAAGYAGVLAVLVWQAYRGQSIIAPDGWTLGALGALGLALVLALAATVRGSTADAVVPVRTVPQPEAVREPEAVA